MGISIHALLAESDGSWPMLNTWSAQTFLSTLSLRRATATPEPTEEPLQISIHALLAESDYVPLDLKTDKFISIHALLAESDPRINRFVRYAKISIHALLAESDFDWGLPEEATEISIHALLAESDEEEPDIYRMARVISIHALLAESDDRRSARVPATLLFLSTLSLRRATTERRNRYKQISNFYPRSPCGERQ